MIEYQWTTIQETVPLVKVGDVKKAAWNRDALVTRVQKLAPEWSKWTGRYHEVWGVSYQNFV